MTADFYLINMIFICVLSLVMSYSTLAKNKVLDLEAKQEKLYSEIEKLSQIIDSKNSI